MLCENRYTLTLCVLRLLVTTVAVVIVAPAAALEGPLLSAPSQRLTDVLPQRLLDEIEVPKGPVRVAARPTLSWRPGLKESSKDLLQAFGDKPEAEAPSLKPVATPPVLMAPNTTPEEEAPKASVPKQPVTPERGPASSPAATRLLPEQAPRAREITIAPPKKPVAKPAAKPSPAVTKPEPAKPAAKPKATAKPKPVVKPQAAPTKPPAPLSRSLRGLRSRMRTVLSFYYRQSLNTLEHDPWEIMHSMLSYELHSRIRDGGPKGPYMTAVGHLCFNRPSKRQRMMRVVDDKIDTRIGVGLQGHSGQLMAMLAQCNVSPEYPIRIDGKGFTIHDLIESEQQTCYSKTELTFKLMGLGHYLESDAEWLNDRGERWDIPRLIKEEREQPIRGAACGGTHRLAGLSLAFRRREARGEPLDSEYAEAAKFVSQYQSYAFRLQNDDGSLSTEWFRGPGAEEDIDRRLRTTGHLLEWLVYSLPDDQLRSYRTVRAVNYLTSLLATNADHEWHLGSIAHAIHALVLYDKRVFRPHDQNTNTQVAAIDPTTSLFRSYPIYRNVMRNSPPEKTGIFGGLFGGSRTGSAAGRRR